MESISSKKRACYPHFLLFILLIVVNVTAFAQSNEPAAIEEINARIHFLNVSGVYVQNGLTCLPLLYRQVIKGMDIRNSLCANHLPERAFRDVISSISNEDADTYSLVQELWNVLSDIDRTQQRIGGRNGGSNAEEEFARLLENYEKYRALHLELSYQMTYSEVQRAKNEKLTIAEEQMRNVLRREVELMDEWRYYVDDEGRHPFPVNELIRNVRFALEDLDAFDESSELPYPNDKMYLQFADGIRARIDMQERALNMLGESSSANAYTTNQLYLELVKHYNEELIPVFYNYITYCKSLDHFAAYEPVFIPAFEWKQKPFPDLLAKKNVDIPFQTRSLNQEGIPDKNRLTYFVLESFTYINDATENNNLLRQRLQSGSIFDQSSSTYELAGMEYESVCRRLSQVNASWKMETKSILEESWKELLKIEQLCQTLKSATYGVEQDEFENHIWKNLQAFEIKKQQLQNQLREVFEYGIYQSLSSEYALSLRSFILLSETCLSDGSQPAEKWRRIEQMENLLDKLNDRQTSGFIPSPESDGLLFQARDFTRTYQADTSNSQLRASFNQLIKNYNSYIQESQLPLFPGAYVPLYQESSIQQPARR